MRGGFSGILKDLRDQLIKFSALIELELDFSQEDVEFADRIGLLTLLENIEKQVGQLLQSFALGNVIKNGVQVAIIGKPNAGKSTLLNTLLNEERAIVSDIAGTTRDTIEETLNIDGILFRLIDTAGIREHTSDIIESIGVERSLEKMHEADVVVYMFDVNQTSESDLKETVLEFEKKQIKYLLIGNKADLQPLETYASKFSEIPGIIFISARENRGIDSLKRQLFVHAIGNNNLMDDTVVTNARHVEALEKIRQSLQDIIEGLNNKIPGDLLALDIRRCLHYLGEITGEITNEDQLDYIFSKFCIGK
jgi:tRNA modification GTPase